MHSKPCNADMTAILACRQEQADIPARLPSITLLQLRVKLLRDLPSWAGLTGLQWLLLRSAGPKVAADVQQLSGLRQLRRLELQCSELAGLPDLQGMAQLTALALMECLSLRGLPASLGTLAALQQLQVSWCACLAWDSYVC